MKLTFSILAAVLFDSVSANVISLNPSNYDEVTNGKYTFIKFFAPWCGHCKAMADDWALIGEEFGGEDMDVVIGDVDCTDADVGNEEFCNQNGVQGFPSLKYGNPFDLQEYEGERDYESLKAFALEYLGPQCGPDEIELCTDEQKILIVTYMNLPDEELQALIDANTESINDAQLIFQAGVEVLEEEYNMAQGGLPGDESSVIRAIIDDREAVESYLKMSDDELSVLMEEMQASQASEEEIDALIMKLQEEYEKLQAALDAEKYEINLSEPSLMHSVSRHKEALSTGASEL
mmetsp:Transcript_17151/g.16594  ORF Transcript_17151/g.16594 Transcript_17151/m.16594 type:complete len:291 (-) Transcript_17151:177-1049(-)|eukprot:CAMPEP_0197825014 /NCGR_PEP_ID=MMETSP1437-20131217/2163_1 /TAXON_ID=49252 ORGANISM="Eucampia antarctica, Strain CCMP1452" /NCGR_SAMPLE_ID=MMETSP1437 /ASSEMBLY_ACC=CAM_ASM_001096 /LENGTH=290 /DNA_ID=CAMNT_0043424845 /DNA_START=65 /DNA_END=937 /DNA_ORIENTATION=-